MNTQERNDAKLLDAVKRLPRMERDPSVIEAAERQMQQWLRMKKARDNAAPAPSTGKLAGIGPYLTISREAGAGGSRIARLVGEAIGWEVLDRKLLEYVAERYDTSPAVLELVDETTTNWLTEMFGNWFDPASVSQMQYVCRLSRVILMAAQAGKVIYVGRGANSCCPTSAVLAFVSSPRRSTGCNRSWNVGIWVSRRPVTTWRRRTPAGKSAPGNTSITTLPIRTYSTW